MLTQQLHSLTGFVLRVIVGVGHVFGNVDQLLAQSLLKELARTALRRLGAAGKLAFPDAPDKG